MIPRPLEAVILKAMDKDKRLRYATAEEMALDLERFLKDESVLARPPGALRKLARRVRANPVAAGGVTAFILAVAVMIAILLRPRPEAPPPVFITQPPAGPPSAASEIERAWREGFLPHQVELAYHNFTELPPERIVAARKHVASMPPTLGAWAAEWFLGQAVMLPADVWLKREWMERRSEAARRVRWCRAVQTVLEGRDEKFSGVRKLAAAGEARFAPVAAYLGQVSLTIAPIPFAEIRSLRSGETWIVKDGRKTSDPSDGPVQNTPARLDDLDIADYTLVLVHPKKGERALSIAKSEFRHGRRYVFSGFLDRPESFVMREDR
jgi:hypothetical protein